MSGPGNRSFELNIAKEDFKFSAAHFVAHDGGRERLHGHNYRLRVSLRGDMGPDGYVIDFADAKASIRAVCKELDEMFLLPTQSTSTSYKVVAGEGPSSFSSQVYLTVARDGSNFSFPLTDVALLPIANSTVEELSRLLAERIADRMGREELAKRRVTTLSVGVTETPGQEAVFTLFFTPHTASA